MDENMEILKLRVLLCFLQADMIHCTVTGISRTLNKEKYVISRILTALEKEGLIDRSYPRSPVLTKAGRETATHLSGRLEVSLNHLLYEGVGVDSAKQDALVFARYCTEETMDMVRSSENRYRMKYELRDQKQFSGARVCKLLEDGSYSLPFVMYREQVKDGHNISVANDGFEHPCILRVEKGAGTIHLRAIDVIRQMPSGAILSGRVAGLRYFQDGWFISAESSGNVFSFPAGALRFLNFATGTGQILHGSVCLQLECLKDKGRTAQVIFTIMM